MKRRSFLALFPLLLWERSAFNSQASPDFSGTWKQSNERCVPKRNGDVTLRIDQHDPDFTVETTALRKSGPPRHALQRYTTDGKISESTGADGDEFRTSIIRNGQSLAFSVEEHEDGRVIFSKETWTLIDNGAALQRDRENLNAVPDETRRQRLIYLRVSTGTGGR